MSFPAKPPSKLGYYRVLSPLAGVRVSPIQLGSMTIGDQWENQGFGFTSKETSFQLLDTYYDLGGNFIDTSNNYQSESSEEFIGEWMERRGIRDQLVIATKFSTNYKAGKSPKLQVNYMGNHTKSLHLSLKDSLRKLRTDYVDILYVHWWGYETSVEEVMNSLHNLVVDGKVLYLGISDTPAWVVAQANTYARLQGKTPFSIYQGNWNVLERSFERDIIPMAKSLGLALAPWNVVGGGKFRTDAEDAARKQTGEKGRTVLGADRNENERKISYALEKVAKELGVTNIRAVAIAYVLHKAPYVFPILGGRKVEHLTTNLEALDISLSQEQIKFLESAVSFDPGFPVNFFGDGTTYNIFQLTTAQLSMQPAVQPIPPVRD